jgi:hypothetical protein
MMITMAAVLIMKVATDNIVDVIAMGNAMMPTLGMMPVCLFMPLAGVIRCAGGGITGADA